MQNDILGKNTRLQLTNQIDPENLRYHEPQLASNHNRRQISSANTGPKSAKSSVSRSMRISDNYYLSRMYPTFIGQNLMADTLIYIHQFFDTLFKTELSELLMIFSLCYRSTGSVMIKKHHDLISIKNLFTAHFIKGTYSLQI